MEEKHSVGSTSGTNGASNGAATAASNGTSNGTASGSINGTPRRKRPSSLSDVAAALPTVESSLENFISRANSTILDVAGWAIGEAPPASAAEQQRIEYEAARIREAVAAARAEAALEHDVLRQTIDDLNIKLANAEAKIAWQAANATTGNSNSVDPTHAAQLAELRTQIEQWEQRVAAANVKIQQAEMRATAAEARAQAAPRAQTAPPIPLPVQTPVQTSAHLDAGMVDRLRHSEERARIAEQRAAKALAAARAAAAGLTVSTADLDQIQSGLIASDDLVRAPRKKAMPMPLIVSMAFIGGLAFIFVLSKLFFAKPEAAAVAPAPVVAQPAPVVAQPAPVVAQPAPTVAQPAPAVVAQPAPVVAQPAPAAVVTAQPIEVPPAPVAVKPAAIAPTPAPTTDAPPVKHVAKPAATHAVAKPAGGDIVDPFAATPAPAPKPSAKKAAKPAPASGIVDPF